MRFRYRSRADAVARFARDLFDPPSRPLRVLDLGCADGRTTVELQRLLGGGELLGVERSRELLAAAPPLPTGVQLVQGDVTGLPPEVPSGAFDLVTALAILEHLSEPRRAVAEARRCLRPAGVFMASCPHPGWDALACRLGLLEGDQHPSSLGRRELVGLIESAGMSLVAYRRFMWAPVGALPYLRLPIPPSLAAGIDRAVGAVRLFDALFVNQLVVGRASAARPCRRAEQ